MRSIWGLAKELGLSDDHLYLVCQSVTGMDSLSVLVKEHPAKAQDLITHLSQMLYRQNRSEQTKRFQNENGKVFRMPSNEQHELVEVLEFQINRTGRMVTAESIAKRTYRKPYRQLSYTQMQGLIEALKSIRDRLHLPDQEPNHEKNLTNKEENNENN